MLTDRDWHVLNNANDTTTRIVKHIFKRILTCPNRVEVPVIDGRRHCLIICDTMNDFTHRVQENNIITPNRERNEIRLRVMIRTLRYRASAKQEYERYESIDNSKMIHARV